MPNNTGPMTKDNMVELKPCPFCGGGATVSILDNAEVAECIKCGASVRGSFEAWNTRATMHGSDSGVLREALAKIRALALSGDFSPDDIGGDIGTISLRNPDGLEILGIIDAALNLSSETGERAE